MSKNIEKEDIPEYLITKLELFFKTSKSKTFSFKELTKLLGTKRVQQKNDLKNALDFLVVSNKISLQTNGLYKSNETGPKRVVTGKLDHVNPKFAFVIRDDRNETEGEPLEDIKISSDNLNGAIDGDKVKVYIFQENRKDRKPEGEIIEVLERNKNQFVGIIEMSPKFAFVIPDNKKIFFHIFIPGAFIGDAKHGQKVVVRIKEWATEKNKNPTGDIIEILGNPGENETEIHAIMAEYGLPYHFPNKVLEDAEYISDKISKSEIAKRRDFRDTLTFTIDPHDAKDFDDALSVDFLDNGNIEVGVHIADVTHYVKENTFLEKEAYNRATSVYLVDRVVPMLPERLSNELCSLRPHEDKLTFSAVFELTPHGRIVKEWFGRTIIHSDRRFTYEEAQEIIENKKGDHDEEILTLNELAHHLRNERFRNGAVSFETVEVKFNLDDNGKPLGVYTKVRKDAHKLIEEFMLLANKRVAEFVFNSKKGNSKNTMVYRIHGLPDTDKLKALSTFAGRFGHKLIVHDESTVAHNLNKLTAEVEGKPEQNVLQGLAVRCMAKAVYTTETEGHFGLAFKHYTHFTSPIRRYPDMMVHRLLQHYLDNGKSADKELYEEKCEHSSDRERMAAEAERASIKFKQVEFMSMMGDKTFEGIISGVIETGFFVETVDTKCEGLIRLADLTDDYYEADTENYRVIGKKKKKMYTLGDTVKVKVKKTDLQRRTIDLTLVK